MNTWKLMTANHTMHQVASRAPSGTAYDFSKIAAPLPKFAAAARPVSLAPAAKPAGAGLDLFRMKSRPTAEPASVATNTALPTAEPTRIGTPVRVRSSARMVQGNLGLNAVKVMRNDLRETDFEIISPQPVAKVHAGGGARVEPAGIPWAGWLARMMGAVRSRS